jgi:hypothetical protein
MKLGKRKAKRDTRNILFKRVLAPAELPRIPDSYDVDKQFPFEIPHPPFGNLEWSCCVMAERANHTLRFEAFEQHRALNILESQVLEEYWREGGGDNVSRPDNGLYMLDSLKDWRSRGWLSRGYNIYAFTQVSRIRVEEIKAAIFLLNGLAGGVILPQSAMDQFDAGQPWSVTSKGRQVVGGHAIYIKGYSPRGVVCKTWSKDQFATWEWFLKQCDELYGVVDNVDRFLKNSPVDVVKLRGYLSKVSG